MANPSSAISTTCILNTPEGLAPVNWLGSGDLIETRDDGFQPIKMITRVAAPENTVTIPENDGVVSPDQLMLAGGWAVQLYCGVDDALCNAGLITPASTTPATLTFVQIAMHTPMLLRMGNVWIESHTESRHTHPVLTPPEFGLIHRAGGCPLVRHETSVEIPPLHHSTTFGSQTVAA